jgi:hypothetical protein
VAGGQQAGGECAESEERGGCEQTARGKGVLHPVGEDSAEKAVKYKADDNARGRTDQRDARGDPEDVRTWRAERQADAELRSALRKAVSDDAEDADQRKRERHGGEGSKQDGEEPLAAILRVALDGLAEGEGAVEGGGAVGDLLVESDGCNNGADGVQAGERITLGADEELRPGRHHSGVRNVCPNGVAITPAFAMTTWNDSPFLSSSSAHARTLLRLARSSTISSKLQ